MKSNHIPETVSVQYRKGKRASRYDYVGASCSLRRSLPEKRFVRCGSCGYWSAVDDSVGGRRRGRCRLLRKGTVNNHECKRGVRKP